MANRVSVNGVTLGRWMYATCGMQRFNQPPLLLAKTAVVRHLIETTRALHRAPRERLGLGETVVGMAVAVLTHAFHDVWFVAWYALCRLRLGNGPTSQRASGTAARHPHAHGASVRGREFGPQHDAQRDTVLDL